MRFSVLIVLFLLLFSSSSFSGEYPSNTVLNLYNWVDYISLDAVKRFEQSYGVKVNVFTYKDEEEMLSVLIGNNAFADIIITGPVMIKQMIDMRMLARIDRKNIPNIVNVMDTFKDTYFDRENVYSVPYLWGTTGLAINTEFVKEPDPDWNILWNPQYKGHIGMFTSALEAMPLALFKLGYRSTTGDMKERRSAGDELIAQKQLVPIYGDVVLLKEKMISGDLWASVMYSGDAVEVMKSNPRIRYVLPVQGFNKWFDSFCITRDSEHKELAEQFIDFMQIPENAAANASEWYYSTCNFKAKELLSKEIIENKDLYPPAESMQHSEFYGEFKSSDDEEKITVLNNRIWAQLQAEE